ncbi:hypothetical protein GCM10009682_49480 [Luedemannella flava]|uniref:Carboxypeptidase regulatory-like domain-containing protein n=1 Tax=Luedemannella flava TaxID=349316 RepID=A0ABN2MEJ2_9ACTN
MATARLAVDLTVAVDHGQFYAYDPAVFDAPDAAGHYEAAVADAIGSRRFVGTSGGLLAVITPGQWGDDTPVHVAVRDAPADPGDVADHVVDLDLDVPTGVLAFESTGGPAGDVTGIPPGRYRVRVAGRGFTAVGGIAAGGGDAYRLTLWPRDVDTPPVVRRAWPGWADHR